MGFEDEGVATEPTARKIPAFIATTNGANVAGHRPTKSRQQMHHFLARRSFRALDPHGFATS